MRIISHSYRTSKWYFPSSILILLHSFNNVRIVSGFSQKLVTRKSFLLFFNILMLKCGIRLNGNNLYIHILLSYLPPSISEIKKNGLSICSKGINTPPYYYNLEPFCLFLYLFRIQPV